MPHTDVADAGTPVSIETALRHVRFLACVLVAVRLVTASNLPRPLILVVVVGFASVNLLSLWAQRASLRTRTLLGVVQVLADTAFVLIAVAAQHGRAESADWAILVLPVIEGAIRFQSAGAVTSWLALAGAYGLWNFEAADPLPLATIAQRLTVVFLVALPSGFLAELLVAEIASHRRRRDEAVQRSALLRAAALGGRRSTRLDVDEILDVIRLTVGDMGFAEPQVFELSGNSSLNLERRGRYVSHATCWRSLLAIRACSRPAAARESNRATVWPPDVGRGAHAAARAAARPNPGSSRRCSRCRSRPSTTRWSS